MSLSTFWKLSIYLTIIGSAYSGWQYYSNVQKARVDVAQLTDQLNQSREFLQYQKQSWDKIEAARARLAEATAKKSALLQKKEELEVKSRSLEGEFKYLVKSTAEAVEKARVGGVNLTYPEVKLTDGKILKDAKIRKVEDRQISFIHTDGIGSIPYDLLPDELRTKFDMGNSSLAVELATLENNIFSPGGEQDFEGLTLKCPFVLTEPDKKLAAPTPGGPIKSIRNYVHKTPKLEIQVASVAYMDGFALNLADAVAGLIKGISSLEGMSNQAHKASDIIISRSPAQRVSFSANRFGDILYMELVYVIRGQHLWFVQTMFSEKNKESRPVANSILSSIALK